MPSGGNRLVSAIVAAVSTTDFADGFGRGSLASRGALRIQDLTSTHDVAGDARRLAGC